MMAYVQRPWWSLPIQPLVSITNSCTGSVHHDLCTEAIIRAFPTTRLYNYGCDYFCTYQSSSNSCSSCIFWAVGRSLWSSKHKNEFHWKGTFITCGREWLPLTDEMEPCYHRITQIVQITILVGSLTSWYFEIANCRVAMDERACNSRVLTLWCFFSVNTRPGNY